MPRNPLMIERTSARHTTWHASRPGLNINVDLGITLAERRTTGRKWNPYAQRKRNPGSHFSLDRNRQPRLAYCIANLEDHKVLSVWHIRRNPEIHLKRAVDKTRRGAGVGNFGINSSDLD